MAQVMERQRPQIRCLLRSPVAATERRGIEVAADRIDEHEIVAIGEVIALAELGKHRHRLLREWHGTPLSRLPRREPAGRPAALDEELRGREVDVPPSQREQLSHAESAEGGDDVERRVLLVCSAPFVRLLGRDRGARRITMSSRPRRACQREHLFRLIEVGRVSGSRRLSVAVAGFAGSLNVSSRIACLNTEHSNWQCLFTVRGVTPCSAWSVRRKRAISDVLIAASGRDPNARMIRAAGRRPRFRRSAPTGVSM